MVDTYYKNIFISSFVCVWGVGGVHFLVTFAHLSGLLIFYADIIECMHP